MNKSRSITEIAREIHANAVAKGFYDGDKAVIVDGSPRTVPVLAQLAMIHGEVSEASEAARDEQWDIHWPHGEPGKSKPEGLVVELADAIIRSLDLATALDLPIEEAIRVKTAFNKTRGRLHGRKA